MGSNFPYLTNSTIAIAQKKKKQMNPEQQQEIIDLRARKLTPKQIARKLGLKVSEVNAFLQNRAQETALVRAASGELDPIADCFVDTNCAESLLEGNSNNNNPSSGLGLVFVARSTARNRFQVCNYLIDYWCLGVKDTLGPRNLNSSKYEQFIDASYDNFLDGYRKITIEQARAIVFGAADYAAKLGFTPHKDFQKSRSLLGEWNGQPQLKFGRNGKPYYVDGPYDNQQKIIQTLKKNVGEGNFDFMLQAGGSGLFI